MKLSRRETLASTAALTTLIAGCQDNQTVDSSQNTTQDNPMTSELSIGDSAQALYENIKEKARLGYTVELGCTVSINSGTLGQSDTLSVASGTIYFGGSEVSVSSQNAQIDAADPDNPRKDVVYLDGTGTAQVAKGTPAQPPQAQVDAGAERFEFYQPSPPALDATDAVVLAEVWVDAATTTITGADFDDWRTDETAVPTLEEKTSGISDDGTTSTWESVSTGQHQITGDTDITVSVPSDYSTVAAALDATGEIRVKSGIRVEINIESGHQIQDDIDVSGGDWGHVAITSDDPQVTVSSSGSDFFLFRFSDCQAPVLGTVIDCNDLGIDGVRLTDGAEMLVTPGSGVINAGEYNVRVTAAILRGREGVFTGGARNETDVSNGRLGAIYGERGARLNLSNADVSDSLYGLRITEGSVCSFRDGLANDCNFRAVSANRGAWLLAHGCEALNASRHAAYSSDGSMLDVRNASADGAGTYTCRARRGGRLIADRMSADTAGEGTFMLQGGIIHAGNLPAETGRDLWATEPGNHDSDYYLQDEVQVLSGQITDQGFAIIDGDTVNYEHTLKDHALHVMGLNGSQSITAGTQTRVEFNTVEADPFGLWDATNYEWEVPFDGIWRVRALVAFENSNDGDQLIMYVGTVNSSGSATDAEVFQTGHAGNTTSLFATREVDVSAGDTISVEVVNQDSDDSLIQYDAQAYLQISHVRGGLN